MKIPSGLGSSSNKLVHFKEAPSKKIEYAFILKTSLIRLVRGIILTEFAVSTTVLTFSFNCFGVKSRFS